MLQLRFTDKYLDCSDFQMWEMYMDSAYIAIAGEIVESLVKKLEKMHVFRVCPGFDS